MIFVIESCVFTVSLPCNRFRSIFSDNAPTFEESIMAIHHDLSLGITSIPNADNIIPLNDLNARVGCNHET